MAVELGSYERRARLFPGLLAMAPIGICGVALGIEYANELSAFGGILISAGSAVVLMGFVRERGRLLQRSLYEEWGGEPTTNLLRTRSQAESQTQRDRWRDKLAGLSGIQLPTADEEQSDPEGADEIYRAVTAWARENTREHKLVFAENREYGFARNLLAMKPFGLALSIIGAVIALYAGLFADGQSAAWTGGVALLASAAFWLFYPTKSRVRTAAVRYAEQLLEAATSSR